MKRSSDGKHETDARHATFAAINSYQRQCWVITLSVNIVRTLMLASMPSLVAYMRQVPTSHKMPQSVCISRASSRENLTAGFPTGSCSNQFAKLHRLSWGLEILQIASLATIHVLSREQKIMALIRLLRGCVGWLAIQVFSRSAESDLDLHMSHKRTICLYGQQHEKKTSSNIGKRSLESVCGDTQDKPVPSQCVSHAWIQKVLPEGSNSDNVFSFF